MAVLRACDASAALAPACLLVLSLAAGQGFEPRFHDPESRVLPLDDPAMGKFVGRTTT